MKTGKLTNVSTNDAGRLVQLLGGRTLLYRDAPLFDKSQIVDLVKEAKEANADSILFDSGAIFDEPAYELARDAVDEILKAQKLEVVIYNFPKK